MVKNKKSTVSYSRNGVEYKPLIMCLHKEYSTGILTLYF